MKTAGFGLVVAIALVTGCTRRNKAVCCTTETDCQALGLPSGSVGDYGCGEGLSCDDQSA